MIGFKSMSQVVHYFCFLIANLPMPGHWRYRIVKCGGVKFNLPKNKKHFVFIGTNVTFDTTYPQGIEIGNYVHITTGSVLLTHYLDTNQKEVSWKRGNIKIEDGVFIGANTVICKPVTIGKHSIVGAGSVVTKNIPPNQIWGGNPAKYIKDR